ncbi:MAG TPA: hypothetical protein VFZ65_08215 [Planctomycetota bacterium]|nr:hypothetical protein [Planctomycetota bacterium]
MERGTFLDASVQQQLAGLEVVKIDIDDPANAAVCRQHHGDGAVPTFVMATADGDVVHRWTGAGDVQEFLGDVQKGLANAAGEGPARVGRVLDELQRQFDRGDDAAVARCLQDLGQLRPESAAPSLDDALWRCCTRANERQDWPGLRAAAQRYLAQPGMQQHDAARVLLGLAEFELTGTITAELQRHIDGLIARLAEPVPGSTVGERLRALLGNEAKPSEAAVDAWVDRANETMDALAGLGAAAAPALHRAVLTRPDVSQDAAIVLARLRLPTTTEQLRHDLLDARLPAWARRNVVDCIGNHKEPRCLPVLLEHMAPKFPPNIRSAAAYGIREILVQIDGTEREDVAAALMPALEPNHRGLRTAVLQTLYYVHAPLPLEDLFELFDDRRPLFGEYVIADNALWIVLDQLGMGLRDGAGGTIDQLCSPEVAAFVRGWVRDHAGKLHWSAEQRRYVVAD